MPRKSKKVEASVAPVVEEASALAVPEETGEPVEAPIPDDDMFDAEVGEVEPAAVLADAARAVTFQLEGQLYGLPIEVVQEIQQLVEFTPLPDASPALVGLIDLRGLVVPAIDLRLLVGLPERPFTLETPMIFCRVRGHVVCLVVDGVEDVVDLPAEGLQPPSGLYSLADKMLGMCRLPQGLLLLLDIERLVPEAALAAAEQPEGDR